jgi:predicted ATPase
MVTIARAVGADVAGTLSSVGAIKEHLGDAPYLLLLDSLERVVAVAPDIEVLLSHCAGVKVLATSRTVLRLRAEHGFCLPALSLPSDSADATIDAVASSSAVQLFVERARAVRADFDLTAANAAAVAQICRRLEGIPLAIELAAARARLLARRRCWPVSQLRWMPSAQGP